jgi:hypothetical protein
MRRSLESLKAHRRSRSTRRRAYRRKSLRGLEELERRHLLAAVSWTGMGDQVNWTDPNNWSSPALPGLGDDVTINAKRGRCRCTVDSGRAFGCGTDAAIDESHRSIGHRRCLGHGQPIAASLAVGRPILSRSFATTFSPI